MKVQTRFSEDELKRYHRQMLIDGWGKEGQAKLRNSTVFIAGAGGLGSPVAIYLAVAGIGNIIICDFDKLDVTNLNRQISHENTDNLVSNADIIVDCMDNFPTRYLLNESAIRKNIPLVYGSIRGMDGMLSFLKSPETPCLRCLFPEAPPEEVFPVVGVTPGVIGTLQALETIKYLTGIGTNIKGKLLFWDGAKMEFRIFKASKDPDCPTCKDKKQNNLL